MAATSAGLDALPLGVLESAMRHHLDFRDLRRLQAVSRGLGCLAQVRARRPVLLARCAPGAQESSTHRNNTWGNL
jgi:hypothetical protein